MFGRLQIDKQTQEQVPDQRNMTVFVQHASGLSVYDKRARYSATECSRFCSECQTKVQKASSDVVESVKQKHHRYKTIKSRSLLYCATAKAAAGTQRAALLYIQYQWASNNT